MVVTLCQYCSFSCITLSSIAIISFFILSKQFLLKSKGLSDARVVSVTKKEYGFSDGWLNALCCSSRLFEILTKKFCAV